MHSKRNDDERQKTFHLYARWHRLIANQVTSDGKTLVVLANLPKNIIYECFFYFIGISANANSPGVQSKPKTSPLADFSTNGISSPSIQTLRTPSDAVPG